MLNAQIDNIELRLGCLLAGDGCKFFSGLTMCVGWQRLSTELAGNGEKQRRLTDLGHMTPR